MAPAFVVLAGPDVTLGPSARALGVAPLVERAAATAGFTGKAMYVGIDKAAAVR